jgi:hypothetical protein
MWSGGYDELMKQASHFSEMIAAFQDTKDEVNNANVHADGDLEEVDLQEQSHSATVGDLLDQSEPDNGNGSEQTTKDDEGTHGNSGLVVNAHTKQTVIAGPDRKRTLSDVGKTSSKHSPGKEIELTNRNNMSETSKQKSGALIATEEREVI